MSGSPKTVIFFLGVFLCLSVCSFAEAREIKRVILHHSATETGDVESFRHYHVNVRGWDDIGYHWIITRKGQVQEGRPSWKAGAHAKGRNQDSLGICLVGTDSFTPEQLQSLERILKRFEASYDIESVERHHEQCPSDGLSERWFY